MSLCEKCNTKMVTVSGLIHEFQADQEPYESGKFEDHDGIQSEVYLTGVFCEKCDLFMYLEIEKESISGLEKDCEDYEKIITKLEQEIERLNKHVKRQDIKTASLRNKLMEVVK